MRKTNSFQISKDKTESILHATNLFSNMLGSKNLIPAASGISRDFVLKTYYAITFRRQYKNL
jgi:hypothetical protein